MLQMAKILCFLLLHHSMLKIGGGGEEKPFVKVG